MPLHEIRKVRHEIVMRALQVRAVHDVTPRMRRITLTGADLEGFHSPAADDHVKLFFPAPGTAGTRPVLAQSGEKAPKHLEGMSKGRDYTPRRHDAQAHELDIDFVLHGDGPASTWAAHAALGHWLVAGGPKGSRIVPDDFDNYIFIGDETALPSIGRRLGELPPQARALTLVQVADAGEHQPLPSRASVERLWVHRGNAPASDGSGLLQALRRLCLPDGDTFIWGAGESRVMRAVRKYLEEAGHNEDWIKTSGYWKLHEEDED
ncbi:MAG: iron-chelator utilization protein [Betaproteobacteria bacterium]|nr:iron-chelator utilization protein [Betaproteobacteria bacterium]